MSCLCKLTFIGLTSCRYIPRLTEYVTQQHCFWESKHFKASHDKFSWLSAYQDVTYFLKLPLTCSCNIHSCRTLRTPKIPLISQLKLNHDFHFGNYVVLNNKVGYITLHMFRDSKLRHFIALSNNHLVRHLSAIGFSAIIRCNCHRNSLHAINHVTMML